MNNAAVGAVKDFSDASAMEPLLAIGSFDDALQGSLGGYSDCHKLLRKHKKSVHDSPIDICGIADTLYKDDPTSRLYDEPPPSYYEVTKNPPSYDELYPPYDVSMPRNKKIGETSRSELHKCCTLPKEEDKKLSELLVLMKLFHIIKTGDLTDGLAHALGKRGCSPNLIKVRLLDVPHPMLKCFHHVCEAFTDEQIGIMLSPGEKKKSDTKEIRTKIKAMDNRRIELLEEIEENYRRFIKEKKSKEEMIACAKDLGKKIDQCFHDDTKRFYVLVFKCDEVNLFREFCKSV